MTRPPVIAITVLALALAACASYSPRPLPKRSDLPQSIESIVVDPALLPFHNLATHAFDPRDGFDIDEIAMLAVANNPQLRQARDGLGIARAQSFAAGLLPDPQLGASFDRATNGTPANTSAFNLNLSYDINALLLRSSRSGAAHQEERRVNLELLWQEWQVVSQARLLFIRLVAQAASMKHLQSSRTQLAERYAIGQSALAAGNVTLDFASAELASLQNVERQINELERSQLQNHASLNGLIGLSVMTRVDLVGEPRLGTIDNAAVRAAMDERLKQRPDMRALRAGYLAQEEKYRGAVLAQFPALNVGLTRARDTSGLYTVGFGLTLSLPILNRNRGNIAIENATRQMLYDEYQNRINSATNEISIAIDNLALLQDQLVRTRDGLAELATVAQHAENAFLKGNFPAADYVRLQTALRDKQTELINLQEASMEQRIALETLLGPDLPERFRADGSDK